MRIAKPSIAPEKIASHGLLLRLHSIKRMQDIRIREGNKKAGPIVMLDNIKVVEVQRNIEAAKATQRP